MTNKPNHQVSSSDDEEKARETKRKKSHDPIPVRNQKQHCFVRLTSSDEG